MRTGSTPLDAGLEAKFTDPVAVRVMVSGGVCLYLLGSLMPTVGGLSLSVVAIPAVAFPLLFTLIGPRDSPRLVLLACLALFGVLAYHAHFGPPPMAEYGVEKQFRLLTSTLLSALCAATIFSFDRLRVLAYIWVIMSTGLAILTIFSGDAFSVGRASVFDTNPIWLARAFASATLFAISLPVMGAHRWWRLAAVPLVIGLILTGSRGPAVGLAAAVAVLLIHSAPRLLATLAGAAVAYGAFTMVPALSNTRIGQTISDTGTNGESGTRTEMWASAWRIWREHPSGVGIGNWSNYANIGVFSWPHNIWLEVAAELGTVAILAFIVAIVLTFRGLFRRLRVRHEYRLVLALLTSETIAVSLSGDLSARTFFFLLFLGVHMIALHLRTTLDLGRADDAPEPLSTNQSRESRPSPSSHRPRFSLAADS